MKFSLIFCALLLLATSPAAIAQSTHDGSATSGSAPSEHEQHLQRTELIVTLRNDAVARMQLNPQQTEAFDAIYRDYVEDKERLDSKRRRLIRAYRAEMRENDFKGDERRETAQFIEDYWDLKIKEDGLEKHYFGKLEKATSPLQALTFFTLEDTYLKKIYRARLEGVNRDVIMMEPAGSALQDVIIHGRN